MMELSAVNLPKITILLATYNRAHLIGETLLSIQAQTYKNWECLIVDDHSEDKTMEVVQKFIKEDPRFSYYLKTEDYKKGLSGTRNYGLDLARERKSQFIQFFDDDDIMHPQKLEIKIKPFLKNSKVDLTLCCYRKFQDKNTINFNLKNADDGSCKIETENLLKAFFLYKINLNSPGPLWKASIILNYRFNEDLLYSEERDLYLRIFLKEKLCFIPIQKILFWYRKHSEAITSNLYHENERNQAISLSNQKFLEEVLNLKKAPYFIIKSLAQSFLKNSDNPGLYQIKKYLITRRRWWDIKYFKLWIYIIINLKLNSTND